MQTGRDNRCQIVVAQYVVRDSKVVRLAVSFSITIWDLWILVYS